MMNLIRLLVLCLITAVALPARAEEQPASDAPHEAALELLNYVNANKQMDALINAILNASMQPLRTKPCAAGMEPKLREFLSSNLSYEEEKPFIADLYAKHFTEAELKELTAFYKTPLGQKTLQEMPKLMQESMVHSQQKLQKLMPEMRQIFSTYMAENKSCFQNQKQN